MSDLTTLEKRKLEQLLGMSGGYVLDFSNKTFDEFTIESTRRSIYDEKYNHGSGSKANQLRGFWKEESNGVVAKLLSDLLDYSESESPASDMRLLAECRKIVARLKASKPVADIDAIAQIADERDPDVVAASSDIKAGQLQARCVMFRADECSDSSPGVGRLALLRHIQASHGVVECNDGRDRGMRCGSVAKRAEARVWL